MKGPSQWGQFGIHSRSESKQLLPCILQITVMTDAQHFMLGSQDSHSYGWPSPRVLLWSSCLTSMFGVEVWGKREELYEVPGSCTLACCISRAWMNMDLVLGSGPAPDANCLVGFGQVSLAPWPSFFIYGKGMRDSAFFTLVQSGSSPMRSQGRLFVNHRRCDHHTPSDRQLRLFSGQASASHHNNPGNCSS